MITRDEARLLVDKYLAARWPNPEDGPRIVNAEIMEEYPGCWVCFWNTKKFIETGDKGYRLGGNYPIIVDKADGTLYTTGFYPVERYVQSFHSDKALLKRVIAQRQ
jgi:hypothetical protein